MEILVRMNTARPVGLCSLWGKEELARVWESPWGAQAGHAGQTSQQTLAGGKRRDPPTVTWQGGDLSLV